MALFNKKNSAISYFSDIMNVISNGGEPSRIGIASAKGKDTMDSIEKYLKALVFLQVQAQTGVSSFGKPEILLFRAGFSPKEIGEILGKSANAVSKILGRAKAAIGANDDREA